jgi:hypothetical protein
MDEMDEIRYRLRISKLEAKLALTQIEAAALAREIRSPLTSAPRRAQATERHEGALAESSRLQDDLNAMRRQFPNLARH